MFLLRSGRTLIADPPGDGRRTLGRWTSRPPEDMSALEWAVHLRGRLGAHGRVLDEGRFVQHYPCYLCGADEPIQIDAQAWKDTYLSLIAEELNAEPRRLVTCGQCGFVQRDPKLTPDELDVLYQRFRDHGLSKETPDEYFDRISTLPPAQSENHQKLEWLEPRLREHFASTPLTRVLDVGCGGGVFLHAFAQRFREAQLYGVEPTPVFAQLADRRLDATIVEGMFQQGTFAERFDVISAIQVLEHVCDPVDFLETVKGALAPGGLAYIEVPDVSDIGHLAPDHDRFMSQHLHIFSERSLKEICRRAGLQVVHSDTLMTVRHKHNLLLLLRAADDSEPGGPEQDWKGSPSTILALRSRGGMVS